MNTSSTIQHKFVTLTKSYEHLLEEVVHEIKTKTHESVDSIWHEVESLRDISVDEATKLKHALRRDLLDAKQYLLDGNQELKFWLGFESGMLKAELWQKFKEATDITPIEILRFQSAGLQSAGLLSSGIPSSYAMGEVIGFGTLACDQCDKVYYFTSPSDIPKCSQCNGTHFHRVFNAVA